MPNNTGTVGKNSRIIRRSREELMKAYDSLPPEVREFIRNAPLNCSISNKPSRFDLEVLSSNMTKHLREATLAAYGPDHPSLN